MGWNAQKVSGLELGRFLKKSSWTPENKTRAATAIVRFARIYLGKSKDQMVHHKELASLEPAKEREPFPVERWDRVREAMSDRSDKDRAIYAVIDFIHRTGCRPNEALRVLEAHEVAGKEQPCLREVAAADLEDAKYAKDACYIAHLHPDQTKTRRQYRWWLRADDADLCERLLAAREYHAAGPNWPNGGRLSYRQVQYKWASMMRQLGIQTRDGRPHTLYSLRRAVAQKAYDERLEEEYVFSVAEEDDAVAAESNEEGGDARSKGPAPRKAIRKPPVPSRKVRKAALQAAGGKLQHSGNTRTAERYVCKRVKDH